MLSVVYGRASAGRYMPQVFLGSDAFVESMRRKIPRDKDLREIPQAMARPAVKALADYAREYPEHHGAIAAAYGSGGYTLQDIGDFLRRDLRRWHPVTGTYSDRALSLLSSYRGDTMPA